MQGRALAALGPRSGRVTDDILVTAMGGRYRGQAMGNDDGGAAGAVGQDALNRRLPAHGDGTFSTRHPPTPATKQRAREAVTK